MAGPWPSHGRTVAEPWSSRGQAKYFPFMEAATAAALTLAFEPGLRRPRQRPTKRGAWGRAPQQESDLTLTCIKGAVLGSALSHYPDPRQKKLKSVPEMPQGRRYALLDQLMYAKSTNSIERTLETSVP